MNILNMFGYFSSICFNCHRKSSWFQLLFPIPLCWIIILIAGCASTVSVQHYENPENGVSLQKPYNWDLTFDERSGTIILKAETGILDKDSARIEIFAGSCPPNSDSGNIFQKSSFEILNEDINRIGTLYDLNSVTIVQESASIETKHLGYEVTKTVIMIPTLSMVDDPLRIQVGKPDPEKFQMIDIFAIQNDIGTIMAYIYSGRNKALNTEAQAVVDSIQQNCRKP